MPVTAMNMGLKPHHSCSHSWVGIFTLSANPQHIAWPFRTIPGSVIVAVAQTESPYLLICLAHQGPMLRFFANILDHILNCFVIFFIVNLKPQTFTLLYDSCSQERCLFPNTSCKDQCVDFTFQLDVITADEAKDAVDDDIEC